MPHTRLTATRDRSATRVRQAVKALERLRDTKLRELRAVERAIRHLADTMTVDYSREAPASLEYRDVGIAAAAKIWVGRMGAPQSTREIAEALVNGGISTRSKDFVSTVYATLTHSAEFQRTDDGLWMLRGQEQRLHGSPPDRSD